MTNEATSADPGEESITTCLNGVEEFVLQEMKTWKVPGLALAVVRDGIVIHAAGYGLRDCQQGLPVTTRTLFPIASVTKSFTVAALAALVRQGKLEWDKPVREYLPDFRLWDASATERITTRDLVTHRSGLARHDWVWRNASSSREELYRRLRYLEPGEDLRQSFQYNNLMYMVAGYLAGHLAGSTWEKVTQEILFTPLGMERATFSIAGMQLSDDYALSYERDDDENVHQGQVPRSDAIGPAGSIIASVEEMIRYVSMHLDAGRYQGRTVIAERDAIEMQTPQIVVHDDDAQCPELGHTQYGMGFYISTYRGHRHVRHDGGIRGGFSSIVSFLPDDRIGAVVLCNMSWTGIPRIITLRVLDQLLGLAPVPWSDRAQELRDAGKASEASAREQNLSRRKSGTHPSHPIAEYVGEYEHPAYGTAAIRMTDPAPQEPSQQSSLVLDYRGYTSALNHVHYDVFEAPADKLNRLERIQLRFESDWNGDITRLCILFEPGVPDIAFVANRS